MTSNRPVRLDREQAQRAARSMRDAKKAAAREDAARRRREQEQQLR